ncbi:hypothetical protein [Chitinivibrio alkaliphilus]|uniref:Uncharacterized protein n=1 Tax=Chitinivibrio alkaliphilus ACht1 TaxID=1313304 RepID=U7DEB4_9BACT|nr:hypothetical protein [Chitinivibrio alkaliphilus]ERP39261.1 hypothetical protein CALK_0052 [Chitinivibrio alkaliphilus ACht1]
MAQGNLSPEEFESLFEELNAIVNSDTSLHQEVKESLSEGSDELLRDDSLIQEAFIASERKEPIPVEEDNSDNSVHGEQEELEKFFTNVRNETPPVDVDFLCPLCNTRTFRARYREDVHNIRILDYECTGCSVLFTDPTRFRFDENREKQDIAHKNDDFSCPVCLGNEYEAVYDQGIGEVQLRSYQCKSCTVLFSRPEAFSRPCNENEGSDS